MDTCNTNGSRGNALLRVRLMLIIEHIHKLIKEVISTSRN